MCHGSVGRLVARTQAVIVDPDSGVPLGERATGELWVRGPQLMRATRQRGRVGGDGRSRRVAAHRGSRHFDAARNLFLADRLKELIKVRGDQVAPAQLEAELIAHPAVADVAVMPRADADSGKVPVAYVALCEAAERAAARRPTASVARVRPMRSGLGLTRR